MTGDKKWIFHTNEKTILETPFRKALGLQSLSFIQKRSCCVLMRLKGTVVYYEFFPKNVQSNSDKYWQLDKLKDAITNKYPDLVNRKGVLFYQNNARPHFFNNRKKIYNWTGIFYRTHSIFIDIALLDYYLL
jgi:hypothetical protein